MGRRANIIPSIMLNVALPQTVHTQLSLHLYSELEGRVPLGAFQRFFVERIREFFAEKTLDLAPYIVGACPGALQVHGTPEAVEQVRRLLISLEAV